MILKIKTASGKVDHWLDYSVQKYGVKLVEDTKATLRVMYMMMPMPIFWALVDQVGSAWTFQARRMNGYIGFYTILPDQMQFTNSLFYLSWIPVCEYILYPAFNKWRILTTTLQKVTCGGIATGLAFLISACVALVLESTYPVEPSSGNGQIRIYNTLPCDISVSCNELSPSLFSIDTGTFYAKVDLEVSENVTYPYEISSDCLHLTGNFYLLESESVGYYFSTNGMNAFIDRVSKHEKGLPMVRYVRDLNVISFLGVI